jgi:NAD(P)-dependent dehydrogenase (short-subunit alcohol dehydrogenase family)
LAGLEETVALIEKTGRRGVAIVADVSDESQVSEMVRVALETFGKVDILINNAGITDETVTGLDRENWDEVMSDNLTGAFLCTKAVVPQMLERGSGKIVNISSDTGKMAYPLRSPFAAAKWGMLDFSATLSQELGPHNIQVNAICAGPTADEGMSVGEPGRTKLEVEEMYLQGTEIKRIVDPQHLPAAVVFFCSSEADSITGEALEIAGAL